MYALPGGGRAGREPVGPYISPGGAGKEPFICWGGGCCGTVLPAPPYPYGIVSARLDPGGGTPEYGTCMGMLFGSVSAGDGFVAWFGWYGGYIAGEGGLV